MAESTTKGSKAYALAAARSTKQQPAIKYAKNSKIHPQKTKNGG